MLYLWLSVWEANATLMKGDPKGLGCPLVWLQRSLSFLDGWPEFMFLRVVWCWFRGVYVCSLYAAHLWMYNKWLTGISLKAKLTVVFLGDLVQQWFHFLYWDWHTIFVVSVGCLQWFLRFCLVICWVTIYWVPGHFEVLFWTLVHQLKLVEPTCRVDPTVN